MAPEARHDGTATVHLFAGEPAVTLSAGPTSFTVLPDLGMLGASLTHRGLDHLDLHGGPGAARGGHTTGMPLLAPWANRLSGDYRAAGRKVELGDAPGLHRDGNGLPIHGTLVGRSGWTVVSVRTQPGSTAMVARFECGDDDEVMASFPFPHTLQVAFTVTPGRLTVATTLAPSARRAVPVSFGWHPYFRIPECGRDRLKLGLPSRHRLVLDERQLPTGEEIAEGAEVVRLAGRTFDDGYRLGRDRQLVLAGGRRRVSIVFDKGYPFAQVYAPEGQDFVALEPMTAPTNALATDQAPVVEPGDAHTARFAVSLT